MNHDDLLKRADRILAISRMLCDPSDAAMVAEDLVVSLRAEVEAHAETRSSYEHTDDARRLLAADLEKARAELAEMTAVGNALLADNAKLEDELDEAHVAISRACFPGAKPELHPMGDHAHLIAEVGDLRRRSDEFAAWLKDKCKRIEAALRIFDNDRLTHLERIVEAGRALSPPPAHETKEPRT